MTSTPESKSTHSRARPDYAYFLTYRTRWSDNDQYGHVNNSVYYHLIDSIVNTYLAERCGCVPSPSTSERSSAGDAPSPPIGLVVSSYCEFFAPITFPETVTLGLRVVKLGRSSVEYEVGFFAEPAQVDGGDGAGVDSPVKAVGGYTHVFVDRMHRRPVKEMSPTLRNGLQAIFRSIESALLTKGKL